MLTVSAASLLALLAAAYATRTFNAAKVADVVWVWGPPGVGKSDLAAQFAAMIKLPLVTIYMGQSGPEDAGGIPALIGDVLKRFPMEELKRACVSPCVLFFDEASDALPHVQAAFQNIVLTRTVCGLKLHPDTVIIMAGNQAQDASGGYGATKPMMGRVCQVKFVPSVKDGQEWFGANMGEDGATFAAVLDILPALYQPEPPPNAGQEGASYGAPRNWTRALNLRRALLTANADERTILAAVTGCVGEEQAAAFLSVLKLAEKLPSVSEIVTDPVKCALPGGKAKASIATGNAKADKATAALDLDVEIGTIGIMAEIAKRSPCAAWVYTGRLQAPETRIACYRLACRASLDAVKAGTPFLAEAKKARALLFAEMAKLGVSAAQAA